MSDELEGLARRLVTGHKSDGRKVFDERAKAEVVALAIRPGTSVSRLARQLDINANQLSRWIREQGQRGRRCIVASQPAFVPVEIHTGPNDDGLDTVDPGAHGLTDRLRRRDRGAGAQ